MNADWTSQNTITDFKATYKVGKCTYFFQCVSCIQGIAPEYMMVQF